MWYSSKISEMMEYQESLEGEAPDFRDTSIKFFQQRLTTIYIYSKASSYMGQKYLRYMDLCFENLKLHGILMILPSPY